MGIPFRKPFMKEYGASSNKETGSVTNLMLATMLSDSIYVIVSKFRPLC